MDEQLENAWPDFILKKLWEDVSTLTTEISNLRGDLKGSLATIEANIASVAAALREDREHNEREVADLKGRLKQAESDISALRTEVKVLAAKWAGGISLVAILLQLLAQHLIK